MMILHQDTEIILIDAYEWTGEPDGIYLKTLQHSWVESPVGNEYKVLINRFDRSLIYTTSEYYVNKYIALESSLVGDVLILGGGLQLLDPYLASGSSWHWIESNAYLAAITPLNGTMHHKDAEDVEYLATIGTFDTILIDFPQTKNNDYASLLNMGGTIIEMTL